MGPQRHRSCREEFVGWAEELIVNAVGCNALLGQPAHEAPQEATRPAQEVISLLQGGVLVQPFGGDQARLVVVLASPIFRSRILVEGGHSDATVGLRRKVPCPRAHRMGAPMLGAVDIVGGGTWAP